MTTEVQAGMVQRIRQIGELFVLTVEVFTIHDGEKDVVYAKMMSPEADLAACMRAAFTIRETTGLPTRVEYLLWPM